jgi:hypothetical protein
VLDIFIKHHTKTEYLGNYIIIINNDECLKCKKKKKKKKKILATSICSQSCLLCYNRVANELVYNVDSKT